MAIAGRQTRSSALSKDLRQEAIEYSLDRVARGATQAVVARELGVTAMTVSRWLSMARPKRKRETKLRRVQVVDAPVSAPRGLVVTMGHGLRIEEMTLEQVVALVRALG